MKRSIEGVLGRRNEDRLWRAERRAGEEQRTLVEKRWRERPGENHGVRATDIRKAEWLAAMRWRRQVQSICSGVGLTFTQWLLLDSTRQLIKETEDAVIQAQIAARTELDQATICTVTQRLEAKGFVDRDVDITGKAWRVILTEKAEQLLSELDPRVESASSADD